MKAYRQDSHFVSLVAWALVCAAAAGVLFWHGYRIVDRALMWAEYVGGVALLVFGPIAFLVYILRARLVWIRVDPEGGIVVSDRYTIPWGEIDRIERRRPRLRKKAGPAEMGKTGVPDLGGCGGCGDVGAAGEAVVVILAVLLILIALAVVIWLFVVVVIPLLLIPVLEVFAPLGDRIKIFAAGRKIVLRDLRDADGFLREVGNRVPVVTK